MIEPKPKKCKGTGKAINFTGCGKESVKRIYGLCMQCYPTWLYKTPEGQEKINSITLKVTKQKRDLQKAIEDEKGVKKLRYLITNTITACHDYIKLRDKGMPCVSCGEPWNKNHQAGHFKKAEIYSNLKFDEFNIHNQCVGCNIHKDGNVQQYRERIVQRIGIDGLERLDKLSNEFKVMSDFKWDREELEKIRKYYINKKNNL